MIKPRVRHRCRGMGIKQPEWNNVISVGRIDEKWTRVVVYDMDFGWGIGFLRMKRFTQSNNARINLHGGRMLDALTERSSDVIAGAWPDD